MKIYNIPNFLTILRIAVVPLFIVLFSFSTVAATFWAGVIFVAASLTDLLDGYLARKRGEVTAFGKLLDPMADKLLVVAALIMLVDMRDVSAVLVILLVSREIAVTGLRAVAASSGVVVPAESKGKYKLIVQIVAISFLVFRHSIPIPFLYEAGIGLLWISLLLALYSGGEYFKRVLEISEHLK